MSDIFKEVDEAMQQEKMLNLWNEYKSTIIGAIIVLLITASVTTFYKNWNFDRNAAETAKLIQAIDSENTSEMLGALRADTRAKHAALATLIEGGIALEEGNTEKASALYRESAESKKTPRDLRDLARLLYVQNTTDADKDFLRPVLSNDKSPWLWHARIEAAVMSASTENYDEALSHLNDFAAQTTIPLALKQRASALSHVYKIKQATLENTQEKE